MTIQSGLSHEYEVDASIIYPLCCCINYYRLIYDNIITKHSNYTNHRVPCPRPTTTTTIIIIAPLQCFGPLKAVVPKPALVEPFGYFTRLWASLPTTSRANVHLMTLALIDFYLLADSSSNNNNKRRRASYS
jgi:hypothetical protein